MQPDTRKVCETCKFFESRTKFCRKNPPTSLIVHEDGKTFMTSSFPKIQMPQLDFCAEHELKTSAD